MNVGFVCLPNLMNGAISMKFEIAPKEYEAPLQFQEAKLYCFSLNIDGKIGWRLPTIKELDGIYTCINDFNKSWYWSSTEVENGVWFKSFNDHPTVGFNEIIYFDEFHTNVNSCLVRPVRDL